MKQFLTLSLTLATATAFAQLPGSGKSLQLNGAAQFISIPDSDGKNDFGTSQNFSVECWVKVPATQTNAGSIHNCILEKWTSGIGEGYAYILRLKNQNPSNGADAGKINFARYDQSNNPTVSSTVAINDNKWHHIAATRSGGGSGTMQLYVDGVLQGSTADNTTGATGNTSPVFIGRRGGVAAPDLFLDGQVDEVRIWNVGLSQAQVRERMCRKITASDALYSNLTAYYNFDEASGNTFTDSRHAINGTGSGSPSRATSGAPIGNSSSFSYGASSATHAHPTRGDQYTATLTSGSASGLHVYNIAQKPNSEIGITGVGGNDGYFGVFVVNGVSAQYSSEYNYDGIPGIWDESELELFKRSDNVAGTWVDANATLNTVANTLTGGDASAEYMVGSSGTPLPVSLLLFSVSKHSDRGVLLTWQMASESFIQEYVVEQCHDGTNFRQISVTKAKSAEGMARYEVSDNSRWTSDQKYYRLRIVGKDGSVEYSRVAQVSGEKESSASLSPNPAKDFTVLSGLTRQTRITLTTIDGRVMWQKETTESGVRIDTRMLPKGIYTVTCEEGDRRISHTLVKD